MAFIICISKDGLIQDLVTSTRDVYYSVAFD